MTTEADGIPEDRPCHRCGKNPAEGFASVWTKEAGERWYCHGDDDEPSCYEQASWAPAAPKVDGVLLYLDILESTNPSPKVQAVIDQLRQDMGAPPASEVRDV